MSLIGRTTQKEFFMSKPIRSFLIFTLAASIATAYSPATFADKKNNNSSNSDDNNDKDKDKDKDKQNNQHRGRDRQKDEGNTSNTFQQFQNSQGNSNKQKDYDKQGGSKNSGVIINNGAQSGQFQKFPQGPNFQKQQFPNGQKPNNAPQNVQLPGVQNKPDWMKQ